MTKQIRHRFRVIETRAARDGKEYHIFPLIDESNSVWTNGHVLGTYMAVHDMPYAMPISEEDAWKQLPKDVEVVPPETPVCHIYFIYKEGNKDWTTTFPVDPKDLDAIVKKVEQEKSGWVTFETFSRRTTMINLSEVTRIEVWND